MVCKGQAFGYFLVTGGFFKCVLPQPVKVIRDLAAEHMTMVIVTHEIGFARNVADRVVFMAGGVIVEEGSPEEVIDNPRSERTRVFLSNLDRK